MFSNLETNPIDDDREGYEAKKGLRKFFVARGNALEAFDPAEEVFHHVAVLVESFEIKIGDAAGAARRNAGARLAGGQLPAKRARVEAPVGDRIPIGSGR